MTTVYIPPHKPPGIQIQSNHTSLGVILNAKIYENLHTVNPNDTSWWLHTVTEERCDTNFSEGSAVFVAFYAYEYDKPMYTWTLGPSLTQTECSRIHRFLNTTELNPV